MCLVPCAFVYFVYHRRIESVLESRPSTSSQPAPGSAGESAPSSSSVGGSGGSSSDLAKAASGPSEQDGPPTPEERSSLDQLVHTYLVGSGRELAAASFVDESGHRPQAIPASASAAASGSASDETPREGSMRQAIKAGLVAVFRGAVRPTEEAAKAAAEAGAMKVELQQLRSRVGRAEQLAQTAAEERKTWAGRQQHAVEDAAARARVDTRRETRRSIVETLRSVGLKSLGLSAGDVPDAAPAEDEDAGSALLGGRLQDLALVDSFEADGLLLGADAIVRAAGGSRRGRAERSRDGRIISGGHPSISNQDLDDIAIRAAAGTGVSSHAAAMRIVRLLASSMPELSKHVVTRHRSLLFPLYAATAAAHPSPSDRRTLVAGLLTAVRRPRPHERAGILR